MIKEVLLYVSISILALISLYFLFLWIIYSMCFYNSKRNKHRFDEETDMGNEIGNEVQKRGLEFSKTLKHSDYYTYSFDKKKLYARFYHNNPSSKTIVIEFHGYKGNCVRDMTGGLPFDYEKGLNIFMVDLRGHGRSDGTTISFGVLERYDVKTWVDFVLKEFGEDISIYLYGASMGAATILMASEFNFPKQVKGIIADCPFSDPLRMVGIGAKLKGFKSKFILDSLRISSKVYGHFDIRESSAINSVKNAKLPILLFHGEKDSFVPCSMSDEIKKANDSIEYHTFKEADHALSFALYTEEYFDILMKFMERTSKN